MTSPDAAIRPGPTPPRSRLTLWLVLAVCVLPFAASIGLYTFAPPKARMNYGELIEPQPLADFTLSDLGGKKVRLADLKGKWTLIQVDSADCPQACGEKLYKMRQVRLAQGKNMDRVQRLWIVLGDGAVDPALQKAFEGTIIVTAGDRMLLRQLPANKDPSDHIWLVDPLGNVMLRYPPQADATGMKNDLVRLLKVSRID